MRGNAGVGQHRPHDHHRRFLERAQQELGVAVLAVLVEFRHQQRDETAVSVLADCSRSRAIRRSVAASWSFSSIGLLIGGTGISPRPVSVGGRPAFCSTGWWSDRDSDGSIEPPARRFFDDSEAEAGGGEVLLQQDPAGLLVGKFQVHLQGLVLPRRETDLGFSMVHTSWYSPATGKAQADCLVQGETQAEQEQRARDQGDLVLGGYHESATLFCYALLAADVDDHSVYQQVPAYQ